VQYVSKGDHSYRSYFPLMAVCFLR